jgi:predicted O-methyltransferase YrrM
MLQGLRDHVDASVATPLMTAGPFARMAKDHARYLTRATVLEMCLRLAESVPGDIVEFGVASGDSTRVIRKLSKKTIYALDSFEGLREAFENAGVGTFAGPVPDIPGVNIVKGYFEDTCTGELRARVGRIAFAHLDADLYSSTLAALRWLTPLLGNRSLILFDEFIGGGRAEARAFADWQGETATSLIRIAEFDREPSGWGEIPDKRVLFQVIVEEPATWIANTETFLKAKPHRTSSLSDSEKVGVKAGDMLYAKSWESEKDHQRLFGAQLNGKSLPESDWFVYPPHWDGTNVT